MPSKSSNKSVNKSKSTSKSKSASKSRNASKSKSVSKKYTIDKKLPIGIYDPQGLNINPLTMKPYQNLYASSKTSIDGEIVPKTYTNISKIWTRLLVYLNKDTILTSIKNNQVTLAKAGTGVGKTVLIPKIAMHVFDYNEKVICTIPKRVITRSIAEFSAQCLDVKVGEEVGYYFKGDRKISDKTKLFFTTTGTLISQITGSDPYLSDYKCVIIDEAHERSIQTDQLLLLLKKAMTKRKDLKVVIMSATINLSLFRNYFPPPLTFGEVDAGEHTTYEIEDHYLEKTPPPNEWKNLAIKQILKILQSTEEGDILVFVRSAGDGATLCQTLNSEANKLRKDKGISINPFCTVLAGKSSKDDEDLATDENAYKELTGERGMKYTRKIVMSTNVAESSLTVKGIVYVIDCGYEFESSYDPLTGARCLGEEFIAKSSIKQRRGRAGRTRPGVCFHLYTKKQAETTQPFPTPDIQKSDITSDMLNLLKLEYIKTIKDLKVFLNEFIEPPSAKFIKSGLKTLEALGAIDSTKDDGKLTDLGYAISKFRSIKPEMAKALLASYYYKCSSTVSDIVALLNVCDGMIENVFKPFRPDKKKDKDYNNMKREQFNISRKSFYNEYGDIFTLLKAYQMYRQKEKEYNIIKEERMKEERVKLQEIEEEKHLEKEKSIIEHIKEDNQKSIKKNTSNKTKKTEKLLRSLKVNPSVIKSLKKTRKLLEPLKGGAKSSKKTSSKKKSTRQSKKIAEASTRKWCNSNYLNYNKLKMVKRQAMMIHRTVKDIMRGDRDDRENRLNIHKYFDFDIDFDMSATDRLTLSLLHGMFTTICSMNSKKQYIPCFPIEKIKCNINRDSFLKGTNRFIFCDELFMFGKGSTSLKLNMCNKIPPNLVDEIMKIHTMTECFEEPKFVDSFIDLRRGRQTKTKHKRNKNKKNKGYSRKKKQGRR